MIFKRSIIVNKLSFRLIIYTATIPRLTPSLSFPNSSLLLIILRPPCLSSTLSFVPLLPCPSSACLCHFVSSSLASSSNYPSSPRLLVSLSAPVSASLIPASTRLLVLWLSSARVLLLARARTLSLVSSSPCCPSLPLPFVRSSPFPSSSRPLPPFLLGPPDIFPPPPSAPQQYDVLRPSPSPADVPQHLPFRHRVGRADPPPVELRVCSAQPSPPPWSTGARVGPWGAAGEMRSAVAAGGMRPSRVNILVRREKGDGWGAAHMGSGRKYWTRWFRIRIGTREHSH